MTLHLINIKIKSFDNITLYKSKNKIFDICSTLSVDSFSNASLPVSRKKITVLRSPHIDKKSREQFEWVGHKKLIKIKSKKITTTYLLLFLLKNTQFPGIQLKISVNHKTCLYY